MQMLADAMLIDAECRSTNAMFGAVFNYGEEHGVHIADIMPLGRRRAEFERAYRRRLASMSHDELCGPLRERYQEAFPGWFTPK